MLSVRFHGRGGQGVVTAAELLAAAAFSEGRHPARATCTCSCRARSAGAAPPADTIRVARLATESGLFPVFEAEDGEVSAAPIRRQVPVTECLRLQARYAHLFRPAEPSKTIAGIQAIADRNITRYGLLENLENQEADDFRFARFAAFARKPGEPPARSYHRIPGMISGHGHDHEDLAYA